MDVPFPREQLVGIALMVALFERKHPLGITSAFVDLVEERHNNLHSTTIDWSECQNKVCADAREIITRSQKPEVILTPLSFDAYKEFGLKFMQAPFGYIVGLAFPSETHAEERCKQEERETRAQHLSDLPETSSIQLTD